MRLFPKNDAWALAVKVVPGASRQRIVGAYADGIKVTVTAQAHAGAANEAVVTLLADALETARSNVRIIRGHASQRKEVLIAGVSAEVIECRLRGPN